MIGLTEDAALKAVVIFFQIEFNRVINFNEYQSVADDREIYGGPLTETYLDINSVYWRLGGGGDGQIILWCSANPF